MSDFSFFTDIAKIDLGPLADRPSSLAPGPKEAAQFLWRSPDGSSDIGIWECTPGKFTVDRTHAGEFCYLLKGRIVITHDKDGTKEFGAGDAISMPRGWKGTWEVLEHVRKIFVTTQS